MSLRYMLCVQPVFLTQLSVGVCGCTSVTQFYHPGIITDRSTAARFVPSISLCSVWVTSSALPLWPSFLHQRQFINRFTCFLLNIWSVPSTYKIPKFVKKKKKYFITKAKCVYCSSQLLCYQTRTYRVWAEFRGSECYYLRRTASM
jgi:hypothetical protein